MDKPFPAYRGDEPYVFVCYSHDDSDVVYPELAWLHEQGVMGADRAVGRLRVLPTMKPMALQRRPLSPGDHS